MKPEVTAPDRFAQNIAMQSAETQADYRQRMTLLQAEARERRQRELKEQCSPSNSAADRIRIWERLHQLSMPHSPSHPLITIIATDTGLSLDEVKAAQLVRAAAKASPPAG